jgi:hypothetical protein
MQTVWKYPIMVFGTTEIELPKAGKFLCMQVVGGIPCVWALVDSDAPKESRTIVTVGTGQAAVLSRSRRLAEIFRPWWFTLSRGPLDSPARH